MCVSHNHLHLEKRQVPRFYTGRSCIRLLHHGSNGSQIARVSSSTTDADAHISRVRSLSPAKIFAELARLNCSRTGKVSSSVRLHPHAAVTCTTLDFAPVSTIYCCHQTTALETRLAWYSTFVYRDYTLTNTPPPYPPPYSPVPQTTPAAPWDSRLPFLHHRENDPTIPNSLLLQP